jgi:glucose-6-phosphate 1-dehydrogenase
METTAKRMGTNGQSISPSILVVFGPTGDLMTRKIVPALYYLMKRRQLPEMLRVVGFGRREWGDEDLRAHVRGILEARGENVDTPHAEEFLRHFEYQHGNFDDFNSYRDTYARTTRIQDEWGVCANKLFYLAVPPEHYETIFRNLADSGLTLECSDDSGWTRVLVEKPFGDDLATARSLDELLGSLFREDQIYRIDHYLAKEMLQAILEFRFANNLFEGEWNRGTIESIDITLLESIDAEKRGAFYDRVGALRDVGQNHLLQMLSLVTMEQPASDSADDIRAARAALIESLRPMTPGEVASGTFRAQYSGFRDTAGVRRDSATETYFQLHTYLEGARWAGVRVTMESGKSMGLASKRVVVSFKRPERCMCPDHVKHTNCVIFTLEPAEQIEIVFQAKKPGLSDETEERRFSFFLHERGDSAQYVEEYAKLLSDAFRGDQSRFVSTREVEAGWEFIDPICSAWARGAVPLESYEAGSADVGRLARRALERRAVRGEVGVAGLGKMGSGLALNLVDHGWRVVGWNRHHEVAETLSAQGVEPAATLRELVAALTPPRVIWMMVPSGEPVDEVLFAPGTGLVHFLSPGDIVIDGGNSFFKDALPRAGRLGEVGIHYLDCGTSGGTSGARWGACLMVGGRQAAFDSAERVFADVARPGGYSFFEGHGAGHFVKMVHNGIEYGMMEAIAEGFHLMHESAFELDLEDVVRVYQHGSVVESQLVGWLGEAYAQLGSDLEGVSGVVGHTGEAEWAIKTAAETGVPAPVLAEALRARVASEQRPNYAGQVLTALRNAFGGHGLGPSGGPRR